MPPLPRFRFAEFVVSPRQRVLVRGAREVPLIPRYFDLLVLLVARRHEAVHRSDIFSTVWSDVVVSDGALTQAIRAVRRALDDDPREPRFIRTISRHGYRFVCADVVEEPDEGPLAATLSTVVPAPARDVPNPGLPDVEADPLDVAEIPVEAAPAAESSDTGDVVEPLLARLCAATSTDDERRDAAERLHTLGTATALERLGSRPGATLARAFLRDARWDVPGAGPVPLVSRGGSPWVALALVRVRAQRAWRLAGGRWLTGALGASLAGIVTGGVGGFALWAAPGTNTPATAGPVLAVLGAMAGAFGGAGVGAGLSAAEALARSGRARALVAGGAAGGAVAGLAGHLLVEWTLEALFGVRPAFGGPAEGLALGLAAGVGYAWGTHGLAGGGMAAPRGRGRLALAAWVALACALAALGLGAAGRPMVGGLVNEIARASRDSHLSLLPLARAIGEPDFGRMTAATVGAVEGAAFGFGLALGLARRPRRA